MADAGERAQANGGARLIYDFGMHTGEDTDYYLARGYRVVAVEADPVLCAEVAQAYAAQVADGRLTIVNQAIGEQPGRFRFHICENQSPWSTASDALRAQWERQGAQYRTIDVDFVRADDVVRQHGSPYYVKIDIEGHDLICLRQLAHAGIRPPHLSFELDLGAWQPSLAACADMGFDRFLLVDQGIVADVRVPANSSEGPGAGYVFEPGHTGPFGSDLSGTWMDAAEMSRSLRALQWQGRAVRACRILARVLPFIDPARWFPRTQTWYDIHARRSA
jgi:FkbM family methyltransferase